MELIPRHVAIICDGNRRWAREKNLPTFFGHKKGLETATRIAKYLRKRGVSTVTLWAFSTENWDRTKKEVGYLMKIFEKAVSDNLKEAVRDKIKVIHIGRKDRLPQSLRNKLEKIEKQTENFDKYILNLAIDYGGRDEILRAVKKTEKMNGELKKMSDEEFAKLLDTGNQINPYPDVIIRTGGDMRLSGFMSWQAAYAELFFLKKGLPALATDDIDQVLDEYASRQRRFGK